MAVELGRTTNGKPVVDILVKSYMGACFPTPFREDKALADLLRNKIALVGFSPYWSDYFEELGKHSSNPVGLFASSIFHVAETQDGEQLLGTVAGELAENFGTTMLEAEIDVPEVTGIQLQVLEKPPLAQFLVELRRRAEGVIGTWHPMPRMVSDSWVTFAQTLAASDPHKHAALLDLVISRYHYSSIDTMQAIEEEEGILGGFNERGGTYAILCGVAGAFAMYFPQMVVSRLIKTTQLYTWGQAAEVQQVVSVV